MEHCGAGSLRDLMDICKTTLSEKEIAAILKMCLYGIRDIHKSGMIHQDIKCSNILLNYDGKCKLTDHGLSAGIQGTLAKRKKLVVCPYWLAPEVLKDGVCDEKTDC